MADYDNRGKVSLWRNDSRKNNPKAPAYKGTAVAHRDIREGEVLDIALWPNESRNPKAPQVTGKIQDKREQQQPRDEVYQPDDKDDDIPF